MKALAAIAWRLVVLIIGVIAFLFTFALLLAGAAYLEVSPPQIGEAGIALFVAALLAASSLAGFGAAWLLSRRIAHRLPPLNIVPRWFRRLAFVGYFLTFAFGVPAVQTRTSSWAVEEYKRLKASGSTRVFPSHPYIATYFATPILPCVVLTYHEYQLDGLYGFGGFQLYFWYGFGVRSLGQFPLWLS